MSIEKRNVPEQVQMPTYSHCTIVPAGSGLVFCSGQIPEDDQGNIVPGGIQEHALQCLKNLGRALEKCNTTWDKVIKVNIYLQDMKDFASMNEVYIKTVPNPKPSRTCIQAGGLPRGVDIEIEAIAAL